MKLIIYLYIKYLFSFFMSASILFFLFYIFSLIGNLGEKMNFGPILYLSYLNSIQILAYIPSLVILISIVLFMIILRAKNEILIIKEYFSDIKIIFIFFPIVLIFSIFEINKDISSNYINNLKSDFLKSKGFYNSKIIKYNGDEKKIYTVIKGLNIHELSIAEINTFHIIEDKIVYAEYSDDISIIDNNVISNISTHFRENKAFISNNMNMLLKDLDKYLTNEQIFYLNNNKMKLKIETNFLLKLLCLILLFHSLFLMLLSRKVIDKKYNITGSIVVCLLLVIYFLAINSIVIHTLSDVIFILTSFLMSLIFIKYLKYE